MPRFIGVTCNGSLSRRIAQNKTVIGKEAVHDLIRRFRCPVIIIRRFAVFDNCYIQRQPRMMFGIAGYGNIIFHIVFALGQPQLFRQLFLAGHTPIGGLKLDSDALLQQVRLQFRKMGIGFPFHLKLFTETVFYGYQIKFGFIVIRKLMGFIYQ